jgi:hypothetical protein
MSLHIVRTLIVFDENDISQFVQNKLVSLLECMSALAVAVFHSSSVAIVL